MKRGILAVLFLALLTSVASADWWYRYQGTMTWNSRFIALGDTGRHSEDFYVLLCYDTTPWSIRVEQVGVGLRFSGEFDKEGRALHFRSSGGLGNETTVVGRGSFNATDTTLNLQGWGFYLPPGSRSQFRQYRFRGAFVDAIWRP